MTTPALKREVLHTFTIAAPNRDNTACQKTKATKVIVNLPKLPITHAHKILRRSQDTFVQDFITHADFWIGIACFLCSFFLYFNHPTIRGVIFFSALLAGIWLTVLGILTGMLYNTNQSVGLNKIFGSVQKKPAPAPLPGHSIEAATVRIPGVWLGFWFSVEVILLILGMYFEGWVQYVLGFIGFIILARALIYNLNEKEIRAAVAGKIATLAMNEANQVEISALASSTSYAPPHKAREAEAAAAQEARKHHQLLVLTLTDFTLAGLALFSCVVMNQNYPWVIPVTFSSFLCTGFWLIILGKVTGHGDPGHHEHPDEKAYRQSLSDKSIAELITEVRAENAERTPE